MRYLIALLLFAACSSAQNAAPFGSPLESNYGNRKAYQKAWGDIITGVEMAAPTKVRFARLWRDPVDPDPGFPSGLRLSSEQGFVTVLSDSFTTAATTNYVDVAFSAQLTTLTGENAYEGIVGRATVTQDSVAFGLRSQRLPGLGDDFEPFLARRSEDAMGQQHQSAYHGLVAVEPSTPTTVTLEMESTEDAAYVCFLNMVIRY